MRRDSPLFVESSNGNLYIVDLIKKEFFPCHKLIKIIHDIDFDKKKKSAKISLLGDVSLLSKDELKQLMGASGESDGCVVKGNKCTGGSCTAGSQGQAGTCGWNRGTKNCECLVYGFYSY